MVADGIRKSATAMMKWDCGLMSGVLCCNELMREDIINIRLHAESELEKGPRM